MATTIDREDFLRHYKAILSPLEVSYLPFVMNGSGDMRAIRLGASLGFLLIVGPAIAASISGTYVGTTQDAATLLQVVQTNDGQLTGRLEFTTLQKSGQLDKRSVAIDGAADGNTVVINLKPTELLASKITFSGTIEGASLRLTGTINGASAVILATRSNETVYQYHAALLEGRSQQMIAERSRREAAERQAKMLADLILKINALKPRVVAFSRDATVAVSKFDPINQRYKSVTEWMLATHGRQTAIHGDGQASVARSQIDISIRNAADQANELHRDVASSYRDIANTVGALARDLGEAKVVCQSGEQGGTTMGASDHSALRAACKTIPDLLRSFEQRGSALEMAFADSERVWAEEHRKQDGIVRTSDLASR